MTDFRKPLPQLANAYSDTQKKPPERIGTSHVPGPSLAVFLFQRLLSRHPRLAGIFFRSHIYFINRHKGPIHVCPGKYKGLRLSHRASQLLTEWNQVMNLTAITEMPEVVTKHFVDSLLVVNVFDGIRDAWPMFKG